MGESWALAPAEEALPRGGPVARSRLRLPGTGRSIRVRTLALLVSAGLHALAFGILASARLAAPLPEPQPLVEVEFVEMAGARGGGGPAAPAPAAVPRAAKAVASLSAPQAVAIRDGSARSVEPSPPQTAPATPPSAGPASAAGAGSGGGTGGGQGTGSGQFVGSGTGQGGVAVDRMPVAIKRVKPVYPLDARRRGISGQVVLRLFVDAAGEVREVRVESAAPAGVFEDKAVEAARRWKFEPAVLRGAPVGVWLTLPVRFALDQRE